MNIQKGLKSTHDVPMMFIKKIRGKIEHILFTVFINISRFLNFFFWLFLAQKVSQRKKTFF